MIHIVTREVGRGFTAFVVVDDREHRDIAAEGKTEAQAAMKAYRRAIRKLRVADYRFEVVPSGSYASAQALL